MSIKFSTSLTAFILAATVWCGSVVSAEQPPIQQNMPVDDRSSPERIRASIRGFFEVLTRVSGEQMDAGIQRELAGDADSYLQGYRYFTQDDQLFLQLVFDRKAVEERVRKELDTVADSNRSVTGNRPVLLWLAVAQGSLKALLTEGAKGLLPNTITDVSLAHDQPVVLPTDEALENSELHVAQLQRGEVEPILRASANAGMSDVLMGSLALVEGDQWSATWQIPGAGKQWRSQQGTLEQVLVEGLRGYKQLSQRAPETAERSFGLEENQVAVSISGVDDMDDYIWLNQRLDELLGSKKVSVVVVGGQSVLFAVEAERDVLSVKRKLLDENRLSLVPESFVQSDSVHQADVSYVLY